MALSDYIHPKILKVFRTVHGMLFPVTAPVPLSLPLVVVPQPSAARLNRLRAKLHRRLRKDVLRGAE